MSRPLGRGVLLPMVGGGVAVLVALYWNPVPMREPVLAPMPYRVAKYAGGTALRMAMVHDVLHERYLRHGPAWYAARNEVARQTMEESTGEKRWDAMDDLAVGLERVGKAGEAVEVMRRKLKELPAIAEVATRPADEVVDSRGEMREVARRGELSVLEHHHYTAEADLGTALVHGNMKAAMGGDAGARERVREAAEHIERAIAINPAAHFGRERWQAIAIRYFLGGMEKVEGLTNCDMVGDSLENLPPKEGAERVAIIRGGRCVGYMSTGRWMWRSGSICGTGYQW